MNDDAGAHNVESAHSQMGAAQRHEARVAERKAREVAQAGAGVSRVMRAAAQARAARDTGTIEVTGEIIPPLAVYAKREPIEGRPARLPEPLAISPALEDETIQLAKVEDPLAAEPAPRLDDPQDEVTRTGEARAITDQRQWTPTAVPPPTYTLADKSERWEPVPLTDSDYEAALGAAERLAGHTGLTGKIPIPPRTIFADGPAIDVETALDRRRASGR